jgi:hypothetical protein
MAERAHIEALAGQPDRSKAIERTVAYRIGGNSWAVSLAAALIHIRTQEMPYDNLGHQEKTNVLYTIAMYQIFLQSIQQAEIIANTKPETISEATHVFLQAIPVEEAIEHIAKNYDDQLEEKELIEKDPLGIKLLKSKLDQCIEDAVKNDQSDEILNHFIPRLDNWREAAISIRPTGDNMRLLAALAAFEDYCNIMDEIRFNLEEADRKIDSLKEEDE